MEFWTLESWAEHTAGRWIVAPADGGATLTGVSIDSRAIQARQAFVAIRGQRFDGHDFVLSALGCGAGLLVVSDEPKAAAAIAAMQTQGQTCTTPVLRVSDTIAALQDLAKAYRRHLQACGTKVIAVTGSNGKTTTRNLIHSVLSWPGTGDVDACPALRGSQSPKSFNNHIGVPVTLLQAHPGDDYVVTELGTNHPGEIDGLAQIVEPDIAVVTNIGLAHTDTLGSLEAIATEKASLLAPLRPGGLALVFGDQSELLEQARRVLPRGALLWTFGRGGENTFRLIRCLSDGFGLNARVSQSGESEGNYVEFTVPLLGQHNALNALAAAAVARWMGVPWGRIIAALDHVWPVAMRLAPEHVGSPQEGILLINDAYNANPDSMAAALHTLARFPLPNSGGGRRVAILGDMLELGPQSRELHARMGCQILEIINKEKMSSQTEALTSLNGQLPGGVVVFIGPLSRAGFESIAPSGPHGTETHYFENWSSELPDQVAGLLRPGDVVLLKASRGMGLDRLVPAIRARFGAECPSSQ